MSDVLPKHSKSALILRSHTLSNILNIHDNFQAKNPLDSERVNFVENVTTCAFSTEFRFKSQLTTKTREFFSEKSFLGFSSLRHVNCVFTSQMIWANTER